MKQKLHLLLVLISIYLLGTVMQINACQFPPFKAACGNPNAYIFSHTLCAGSSINDAVEVGSAGTSVQIIGPTHGSVTPTLNGIGFSYVYSPTAGYTGPDSFFFNLTAGGGCNATGTISFQVVDSVFTFQNPITVTQPVTNKVSSQYCSTNNFTLLSGPTHGTIDFSVGTYGFTYTYNPDFCFSGTDQFIFSATAVGTNETLLISPTCNETGTININVNTFPVLTFANPINVCQNGFVVENGFTNIYTTPRGIPISTFSIPLLPSHGVANFGTTNPNPTGPDNATIFIQYQPTIGYTGPDIFVIEQQITGFSGCTGCPGCTGSAVVNINVIQQVIAEPVSITGCNGNLTGLFMPFHGSGTFTFSATGAANGTITQPSGTTSPLFEYIPNPGFSGSDSFVYTIQDVACSSATGPVGVFVSGNVVANNLSFSTLQGQTSSHTVVASGGTPPLTYTLPGTSVQGGTIVQTSGTGSGNFDYTPSDCFAGSDSFTYFVTDANGCISNTATVSITVNAMLAPTVAPNFPAVCPNGMVLGHFNITGGSGVYTTFTLITPPAFGQIINVDLTGTGTYLYAYTTITGSFSDSFTFTITDSNGCTSAVTTANVFLLGSPQAPQAANQSYNVCENGSINGMFQFTGGVGPQIYTILTQPSHGTASNNGSSQNFIYTPNLGYTGPDSFTYYYAGLAPCLSLPATVTINVLNNVAPTITTLLSLTACAGGIVSAPINPTGGISPYLSLIQQQPTNGSATGSGMFTTNPLVTYEPNLGFSGIDSFVYQVQDSSPISCFSLTGLARVNVLSTSAPQVQPFNLLDCQAAAVTSNLTASGGTPPYNFTFVSGPNNGAISGFNPITGQFTYTPNVSFSGPDSFVYSVTDANPCQSFTASVNINVDSIITVTPQTLTTTENTSIQGLLTATGGLPGFNCTVPPGQPQCLYIFHHTSGPSNGTLNPFNTNTGQFRYNPATGFNGPDSFVVSATDTLGCSATGTINIVVNPPFFAVPLSLTACSGGSANATFQAIGGSGNYTFNHTNPPTGFVTPVGTSQFIYTTQNGFVGNTSFTYTATDLNNNAVSIPGTVSIDVINTMAPTSAPISIATCFNSTAVGQLIASGGTPPYNFTYLMGPAHGILNPFDSSTGSFVYNPSAGFSGQDTFSYNVVDATGCSSAYSAVDIFVDAQLIANPVSLFACADTCKQGSFDVTGGSGQYSFDITGSGPVNGQVFLGQNNVFTYCPTAGFTGIDSFVYEATDLVSCNSLTCKSNTGMVNISVEDAPTVQSLSLSGCLNGAIVSNFSVTGGSGSYSFNVVQPSQGIVIIGSNNDFVYEPATDFSGSDSFTYTATDTVTGCTSSSATVTVTINGTASPQALPVNITGCPGSSIIGTYSAVGGSGVYTQFELINGPLHGMVSPLISGTPTFNYLSNATYLGPDSFTYTVQDSNSCISNLGTVHVTIEQPIANDETITASVNGTKSGSLSAMGGIGSYTYFINSPSTAGGNISPSGPTVSPLFTYTAPINFTGIDTFTYTVTDSFCTSPTGTVTIDVIDLTPNAVSLNACENTSIQGILSATGGVGCSTYNVQNTSVNGGTITQPDGNCAPIVIYTPPFNFVGSDSFTYTVTDELGNESSSATVSITINTVPTALSILATGCAGNAITGNFTAIGGSGGYSFSLGGAAPTQGIVEVIPGTSTFVYSQFTGLSGTDTFGYIATDSNNCMGQGQVTVINNPVPMANPVTLSACTNVAAIGQFSPVGGNGNYINYVIPKFSTQGGTVSIPTANSKLFTYTPPLNYTGPDSFAYSVQDSNLCTSATGAVNISVDSPNTTAMSLTGCANNSLSGTLTASGGVPGYLFGFTNGPLHGTLNPFNVNTGAFTYNPTANFGGIDSFVYTVTDNNGFGCASAATISIFVDQIIPNTTEFNVCTDGTLAANVGAQGGIFPLTFSLTGAGPFHSSSFSFDSTGAFIYSPATGYIGPDTFAYVVTDSVPCTSSAVTVTINVNQPRANPVDLIACQNTATNGTLAGNGGFGTLTYSTPTVSNQGGTISNDGSAQFVYAPANGYIGPDNFAYTVTDSTGCISATGLVNINVEKPIGNTTSFIVCTNTALAAFVTAINGSGIYTFEIISNPLNGVLSTFCESTGEFLYEPNLDFEGTDSFSYQVTDSAGCISDVTVVTLTINQPLANALTFNSCSGGPVNGNLSAGAVGGSGIYTQFAIVSDPLHGSISSFNPLSGNFIYTPTAGYVGPDNLIYTVSDSNSCVSPLGMVTFNMGDLSANNLGFNSCLNGSVTGLVSASGGTPPYISFTRIMNSQHGNAIFTNPAIGQFLYTPNSGFTGVDSFTYVVNDSGACTSQPAIVFIQVSNPIVPNLVLSVCENVGATATLVAIQGTGSYTFSIVGSGPSNGSVVILNPTTGLFIYTPNAGFLGSDSFNYQAVDSSGCTSNIATVTVTVTNTIVPLTASFTGCENTFFQGKASVTGGSGIYTYGLTGAGPTNGTLLSFCDSDGSFTYVPNTDFTGIDSFNYIATDSNCCQSAVITASISINNLPQVAQEFFSICPDGVIIGDFSVTGGSGIYQKYTPSAVSFNGGIITQPMGNTSPEFMYVAPTGYIGPDGFNFTVTDSNGCVSDFGTVTIDVNSAGIGIGLTVQVAPGQTVGGQLQAVGGFPPYTFALVTPPTQGTAFVTSSGVWGYTAFQTAAGTDFFTFSVADSSGCITTRTVSTRAPGPNNTVIFDITSQGFPFDIIGDVCPLT